MKKVFVTACVLMMVAFIGCDNAAKPAAPNRQVSKPQTVKPVKKVGINVGSLVTEYQSASPTHQTEILKALLQEKSSKAHVAFYNLFEKSDESSLPTFKQAFASKGSGKTLIDISAYVLAKVLPIKEAVEKDPSCLQEKRLELNKLNTVVNETINRFAYSFAEEIKVIAERDHQQLIRALKLAFAQDDINEIELGGPLMGLILLEERGMELLIQSVQEKTDEVMVFALADQFGAYAVFPILKFYENPNSTPQQRLFAGTLISRFSNAEPVMAKVVEAYKHGRFYPIQAAKKDKSGKPVVTMKELMSGAISFWGPHVISQYEKDPVFIRYVGQKHLPLAQGREKAISMIMQADPDLRMAGIYLESLDFNTLSEGCIRQISLTFSPATQAKSYRTPLTAESIQESLRGGSIKSITKMHLFQAMFAGLTPQKREQHHLIFSLDGFAPELRVKFILANLENFTEDERDTLIYTGCDDLSAEQMDEVFSKLSPFCTEEQKEAMEYSKKNRGKDTATILKGLKEG